jgi:hypothetical protein
MIVLRSDGRDPDSICLRHQLAQKLTQTLILENLGLDFLPLAIYEHREGEKKIK